MLQGVWWHGGVAVAREARAPAGVRGVHEDFLQAGILAGTHRGEGVGAGLLAGTHRGEGARGLAYLQAHIEVRGRGVAYLQAHIEVRGPGGWPTCRHK